MTYRRPPNIKPIEDEEYGRQLLKDAQNGCQDSRDAIVLGFYDRVKFVAKQNARDSVRTDDLMADGFIAVGNCIDTFDLDKEERSFIAYVVHSIKNAIKRSDLLFGYTDVPTPFQSLIRFRYKVEQELLDKLLREPTDREIILEMAKQDKSSKPFDEKLRHWKNQIKNYNDSLYKQKRIDLYTQMEDNEQIIVENPISIYDEDPHLLEVESDMEIKSIVDTIRSGEQFPFEATRHIDYDKLMIELGENFLDNDEKLILYHSYGYLDHEKLPAKEINKKLEKPMYLSSLSEKRTRIINKLKNFFC